MAKDVDATLHAIAEKHCAMDAEAEKGFVSQLRDDRRQPPRRVLDTQYPMSRPLYVPLPNLTVKRSGTSIFLMLAERLGICGEFYPGWTGTHDALLEWQRLSAERLCDYSSFIWGD